MNGISLCSGIGGLDIGLKLAVPSYRTICYVEIETFCQDVLLARMADGVLDRAPIFVDIKRFDPRDWRGLVDIVHGGYPCQAFSTAARGRHVAEDLWPEFERVIAECNPRYVFLENVNRRAYKGVADILWSRGYTLAGPEAFTASELGAPHIRRRLFLLAYADGDSKPSRAEYAKASGSPGLNKNPWERIPEDLGVSDGLPHRVDRLKALGNGVVPAVAALAWRTLCERIV